MDGILHQESFQEKATKSNRYSFALRKPVRNLPVSPLLVVKNLYEAAATPDKRRACLRYLLQYQHANADFTLSENKHLGYPDPLCAPQRYPGYFRTEFERGIELITPWFNNRLLPLLKSDEIFHGYGKEYLRNFKLVSLSAMTVIKELFSSTHRIHDLDTFYQRDNSKTNIIMIEVNVHDGLDAMKEKLARILKDRKIPANTLVLVKIDTPNVDCVLLNGGKIVHFNPHKNKERKIQCLPFDQLFEKDVYSLLNTCGVIADRLSVNKLITDSLGIDRDSFDADIKYLGISPPKSDAGVMDLPECDLPNLNYQDEGCELYRRAISLWYSIYLNKYPGIKKFVSPLLACQVIPWITADAELPQLAKAYQNLCEIVMLSLDAFPDIASKVVYESVLINVLDISSQIDVKKGATLYSYGMGAIFNTLYRLLNRDDLRGRQLKVACISQNYFETTKLVKRMLLQHNAQEQAARSLNEIVDVPDILISDIHPNNAALETLFQNDVASWVENALRTHQEKSMILVVDITLNHYRDNEIQALLTRLQPFISAGRLELYCVQSLAKLIQLGSDNFSGGVCFYFGAKEPPQTLSQSSSHKSAFFHMLLQHFQGITAEYYTLIRNNSEWVYRQLIQRFEQIGEYTWSESALWKDQISGSATAQFCATDVSLNVDDGAVYVSINFNPLLNRCKIPKEEQEDCVKDLRIVLIQLAKSRGLPITSRQSFGFSFSNMSVAVTTIRFSIGAENKNYLNRYCELLDDFSYALSKYVVLNDNQFDMKRFSIMIKTIYTMMEIGELIDPLQYSPIPGPVTEIPLLEDGYDESGCDIERKIGCAEIYFQNHQLSLIIKGREAVDELAVHQTDIHIEQNYRLSHVASDQWTSSDLFRLFLQLELDHRRVHAKLSVLNHATVIDISGFIPSCFPFISDDETVDEFSKIKIIFQPTFQLINENKMVFTEDKVYVVLDDFGGVPVQIGKLNASRKNQVFTQCVQYFYETKPFDGHHDCVILVFGNRKPWFNYSEEIRKHSKQNGLAGVVNFINTLNLANLPVLENQSWREHAEQPLQRLKKVLELFGWYLVVKLSRNQLTLFKTITNPGLKRSIIKGMMAGMMDRSVVATAIVEMKRALIVADFFSEPEVQVFMDPYELDNWIQELTSFIDKNGCEDRLLPYMTAVFPLITYVYSSPGSLCDVSNSRSLHHLAEKLTHFPTLKNHLSQLELKIPESAARLKKFKGLGHFFELFMRYPLLEDIKSELLKSIRSVPEELRHQWIISPNFYFRPVDNFEIGVAADPDDLILSERNQADIQHFFDHTGCKQLLIQLLTADQVKNRTLVSAFRWAIMTQDGDLFAALFIRIKKTSFDLSLIERVEIYHAYLKSEVPIQKNILQELDRLIGDDGEGCSPLQNTISHASY